MKAIISKDEVKRIVQRGASTRAAADSITRAWGWEEGYVTLNLVFGLAIGITSWEALDALTNGEVLWGVLHSLFALFSLFGFLIYRLNFVNRLRLAVIKNYISEDEFRRYLRNLLIAPGETDPRGEDARP